jgi:hypothetical protein
MRARAVKTRDFGGLQPNIPQSAPQAPDGFDAVPLSGRLSIWMRANWY